MATPEPRPQPSASPGRDEATAEFLMRLRSRGIRDIAVLRAMERVPRDLFVPHRFIDLASRDLALPIACGQTMPSPFVVAQVLSALGPQHDARVLEIGAGSGYTTALLAHLFAEVLAVERFAGLASAARTRIQALELVNAGVAWGDGAALAPSLGRFERVLVHATLEDESPIMAFVAEGGVAVFGRAGAQPGDPARLVRVLADSAGRGVETVVGHARLRPLIAGASLVL